MKLKFFSVLVFIGIGCITSWGQVSKTIHQTFTLDEAEKVNVNVVGTKVEMKETKGSRVLVETHIKISVPNEALLNYIVNSGRYDLLKEVDKTNGELTLKSKKTRDALIIKGKEVSEELSYTIYMPTSIKVANNSTLVDNDGE
ncbi:MAG: hypothetical protein GY810_10315 [Aureispira sp.]|nr:hypothetical protein [Aureispira sp.]